MSAPGSEYESKKPSKDDYELDNLPEVTQGTVTPVGVPSKDDPEYQARLAQLGLGEFLFSRQFVRSTLIRFCGNRP